MSGWWVYLIREDGPDAGPVLKVGTARDVSYRLSALKCGNWRPLVLVKKWAVVSRAAALRVEDHVLRLFADDRIPARDWIRADEAKIRAAIEEKVAGL